jgi:hypothetical protein
MPMTWTRRVVCVTVVYLALMGGVPRAEPARSPNRIQLTSALRREAQRMIQRSPTFRAQCDRLERTAGLQVIVRRDRSLEPRSYRAKSTIQRLRTGELLAIVDIGPHGNPVEWIAHEFEHILEKIDGLHLPTLAGKRSGVWLSGYDMYETERAIRAGRLVADEVRMESKSDNLVE